MNKKVNKRGVNKSSEADMNLSLELHYLGGQDRKETCTTDSARWMYFICVRTKLSFNPSQ